MNHRRMNPRSRGARTSLQPRVPAAWILSLPILTFGPDRSRSFRLNNANLDAATARICNGRGGGGRSWILSDLKSLLETGKPLSG